MTAIPIPNIKLKRAYEPASPEDGYRIYVDRIWPRGLSHETFTYDEWDKKIAPSTALRHWFHECPDTRWPDFAARYMQELRTNTESVSLLGRIKTLPSVTLLYSSRDAAHNNAVVLREFLEEQLKAPKN